MKKKTTGWPLLAVILVFVLSAFRTVDQNYVWETYKLQVTVPEDFKVLKNTNEEFELEGDGMTIAFDTFEQNVSADELGEATTEAAAALKMENIREQQDIQPNGLEGRYVEGRIGEDRVILAGMLDPESNVNFFVAITFDNEDDAAEADARTILNSIRRLADN
ncbi:hypothetical protein [Spirosoma pomorum]